MENASQRLEKSYFSVLKKKAKNCIKHLNLFHLILQMAWLEIKP